MPYVIRKGFGRCAADEFAVVKKGTSTVVGCHPTQADAEDQRTALRINVKEAGMPTIADTITPADLAKLVSLPLVEADYTALVEAKYNAQQLKTLGGKGQAIKNDAGEWSYPIADEEDLRRAIRAVGRGGGGHDKIRKYIMGRARGMGKSDMIPENWTSTGAKESADGRVELTSLVPLTEALAGQAPPTGRRMQIQLITPGWGASGYYSEAVLKKAAKDKVFGAGLGMYVDHQTLSEQADRVHGERSVKDLAARFTGDARWNGKGLVAEVEVTNPMWRPMLTEMADHVGVSIRSYGQGETGEAEGRSGLVITSIDQAQSVDFVAEAGRGGRVLALLESARRARTPVVEVAGMTANDLRDALSTAVKDAHGGEDRYCWVRDYSDDWVVFDLNVKEGEGSGLFQQGFTVDSKKLVALSGEPVEVQIRTEYVPVPQSAETTETESAEPAESAADEPGTSTETADAAESADNGDEPETTDEAEAAETATDDNSTETTEAAQASSTTGEADMADTTSPGTARHLMERELAEARRERDIVKARESARRVLAEALNDAWIPPATVTRITESLLERLPVKDGVLDETELVKMAGREAERAEREMAEALEAAGMGRPRDLGFGADGGNQAMGLGQAELNKRLEESFKGLGLTDKQAALAAKGRD
jgi:hypothetical protein